MGRGSKLVRSETGLERGQRINDTEEGGKLVQHKLDKDLNEGKVLL
jgi:hypothetical protein